MAEARGAMVLADLGSKVAIALRKMTQATVIDQTVMNEMLSEICKALLQADVNVAQVKHLREQVKKNVDVEALAGGLNKRKMLEQAVCNELCSMLDPGKEPYQPKKKQPNVIMFVGLQVAALLVRRARARRARPHRGSGMRPERRPRPRMARPHTADDPSVPSAGVRQDDDLHQVCLHVQAQGLQVRADLRGHLPCRRLRSVEAERDEGEDPVRHRPPSEAPNHRATRRPAVSLPAPSRR